jgi:hypothetical protein
MSAALVTEPQAQAERWLFITLTCEIGGSLRSIVWAAGDG